MRPTKALVVAIMELLRRLITVSVNWISSTDSLYDFSTSTNTETDMASKVSYSFGPCVLNDITQAFEKINHL